LRTSPRPLIEGLQRLAEGGGRTSGNLAGKTSGPETAVDPMTVPMDDDAQARFDALGEEITAELRAAAGTFQTPILARIAENAAKVALVLAVGRDAVHPVIRVEDAVWAIDFVRHFARRTIDAVERHVADTETEAHLKRLREIIRKAGIGRRHQVRADPRLAMAPGARPRRHPAHAGRERRHRHGRAGDRGAEGHALPGAAMRAGTMLPSTAPILHLKEAPAQVCVPQRKFGAGGFFQYFTQDDPRAWVGVECQTHTP
jgi:hypothetical protein